MTGGAAVACGTPHETPVLHVRSVGSVMPAEKDGAGRGRSNASSGTCNRRSNKPLMEKRRRARINQSLTELKNLIIEASVKKEQTSRSSKLEKADILEMTVRYVQSLQRKQSTEAEVGSDESRRSVKSQVKFEAGFKECTREVTSFMDSTDGFDGQLRRRLANHLVSRLSQLRPAETEAETSGQPPSDDQTVSCSDSSMDKEESKSESGQPQVMVNGLHLISTRVLPTGELAFVWPFQPSSGHSDHQPHSQCHLLLDARQGPPAPTHNCWSIGHRSSARNSISVQQLKDAMWRPW